jgi:endonuclease/exonuclease/phosphatase family metal-dependent hydrolase
MELTLTSWNVHGLPYPFDRHFWPFSRIPRYRVRIDAIATEVLTVSPDIAVFQEVWKEGSAQHLCDRFRKVGYTAFGPPPGGFFLKGGLVTCVAGAWHVIEEKFIEYQTTPPAASSDARVHKGIQVVRLRRGDQPLTVVNTHLQSQYPPKRYADIRRAQIEFLTDHAQTLAQPGMPLLAVGDFNTYPYPSDNDVYRAISTGSWLDLTKEARAACGCETNYDPSHPTEMEGWIDYFLAYRDRSLGVSADVTLMRNRSIDNPFSDHHGLYGRVSINPATERITLGLAASAMLARPTTRREWLCAVGAVFIDPSTVRFRNGERS